ncbi:hypothetical protein LSAT2_013093 [Lamellibrachia satsuma]|nr:hypothetical protein LSAT2_013093 [Lamellibrachia satsuma]
MYVLHSKRGTHLTSTMLLRTHSLPQLVGVLSLMFILISSPVTGALGSGGNDRVLLQEISVLTLYHGRTTTSRRTSPIPQIKCIGGSAGCSSFTPQVVQCYNRGSDGFDVQWECKTDMDNAYRFGTVEVSCEGHDYPEDPYIYRGSCGLEYTLDLTKEGHQSKGGHQHSYYGNEGSHGHYKTPSVQAPSAVGDLITVAIVGLIIYAFYKTCLSGSSRDPGDDDDDSPYRGRRGYGGGYGGPGGNPPPYGFRDDMTGGSCSGNRGSAGAGARGNNGGGFWTGAMTGGILGYLMGNRGGYGTGYGTGYGNRWGTGHGTGWGTGWGSGLGGSTGGWGSSGWGGSSGFGGGSTGTRTASGFGGTRRR